METVGQQFKAAREAKNLTLSEAAARTQIKLVQLEGLESDDYSSMPAAIYAKGFIKLYAKLLELDPGPLVEQYTQAQAAPAPAPIPHVSTEVLKDPAYADRPQVDTSDDGAVEKQRVAPASAGVDEGSSFKMPELPAFLKDVRILGGIGAVVLLSLLVSGIKSCKGSGDAETLQVVQHSSLIASPPEPYLKLE